MIEWKKLFRQRPQTIHEVVNSNDHAALARIVSQFPVESLNACDEEGKTALYYAVVNRCVECVRSLLEGGADPNIADIPHFDSDAILYSRSTTPLFFAFGQGRERIFEMLILAGANVNDLTGAQPARPDDYVGDIYPPLLQAIWHGSVFNTELLLGHGARVDGEILDAAESHVWMYTDDYYKENPGQGYISPRERQKVLTILETAPTRIRGETGAGTVSRYNDQEHCWEIDCDDDSGSILVRQWSIHRAGIANPEIGQRFRFEIRTERRDGHRAAGNLEILD